MLKQWLRYLWMNEDGFFGIGLGPSKEQKAQYGDLANLANFSTGRGEGDIAQADNFWKSILSGDPMKISQVLGPETSAINNQAQEAKKTASEFHNRGGGTNAGMQMAGDEVRKRYDTLLSGLTTGAAGALESSGHNLLGVGVNAHEGAFGEASTIQNLRQQKISDLFKSITSVAASIFGGPGGLFGGATKAGAAAGGAGDYVDSLNV